MWNVSRNKYNMITKQRVLIFPAGSEIGLEIFNSLKYNMHVELFGASGKSDHAEYIYDNAHYTEGNFYIDAPDFIDTFNKVLTQYNIDVIFPTHDSIVLFLLQHRDKLKAKVISSSYEASLIAREKVLTYKEFKDFEFCPVTYNTPYENISFPVFIKPNIGQGGKGSYIIHDIKTLNAKLSDDSSLVVCEYLPGTEFSVDCFSNYKNELLFIGPRVRSRVQI